MSLDTRYLLCIDERDCDLFVSITQTGLFYEVSDGNFNLSDNTVVQISDILDEMVELPLYVRHILGDPPSLSKFYSPNLKLMRVREEETVMGSTLDADEDALPIEIQTNTPIKFEIALNTPLLQSLSEYNQAVEMCNSVSESYVTDMKLAVTFKVNEVKEDDPQVNTVDDKGHQNMAFVPDEAEKYNSLTNSMITTLTTNSAGNQSEYGETEATSEFRIQWQPTPSPVAVHGVKDVNDEAGEGGHARSDPCNDSNSFDEIMDDQQAERLNTVLGGQYFDTHSNVGLVSMDVGQEIQLPKGTRVPKSYSDTDVSHSLDDNFILNSNQTVQTLSPVDQITEEITDFSTRSSRTSDEVFMTPERHVTPLILAPPNAFSDSFSSLPSTVTIHSSTAQSSRSTAASSTGNISLSEFFMKVKSENQNLSMDFEEEDVVVSGLVESPLPHKPYVFTGDVFICPSSDSSTESIHSCAGSDVGSEVGSDVSSRASISETWNSWQENKFRVVRRKNVEDVLRNGRTNPLLENMSSRPESCQSSGTPHGEDFVNYEEPAKSSCSSIVTCKVADEMMSSFNDLRLSLEEITRNTRESHIEHSWREFCLERSCSLPVRSNSKANARDIDEHSQSWEQLTPRKDTSGISTTSFTSTPRYSGSGKRRKILATKRRTEKTNSLTRKDPHSDKAQLIDDASSDCSSLVQDGSLDLESLDCPEDPDDPDALSRSVDDSFTISETSDTSVTEGPASLLAAIAEMHVYLENVDGSSSRTASNVSLDRADREAVKQIKIQHEIKRKQFAMWNDTAEII